MKKILYLLFFSCLFGLIQSPAEDCGNLSNINDSELGYCRHSDCSLAVDEEFRVVFQFVSPRFITDGFAQPTLRLHGIYQVFFPVIETPLCHHLFPLCGSRAARNSRYTLYASPVYAFSEPFTGTLEWKVVNQENILVACAKFSLHVTRKSLN